MNTLHLPLKKEWYEMIERGEKTEEYREIKPYWQKRLLYCYTHSWLSIDGLCINRGRRGCFDCNFSTTHHLFVFDTVRFSYGYTHRTMTFEVESITIGRGRPEWGAPDCDVFIIKLGRRVV